jgi:hypothetical protein
VKLVTCLLDYRPLVVIQNQELKTAEMPLLEAHGRANPDSIFAHAELKYHRLANV